MNSIYSALQGLKVGDPQQMRNLTMFPLFGPQDVLADYLTLDEALAAGKCRITELSQGGSVPELAFESLSAEKILLLDGEELVGAKQNRVLNLTILIGGQLKVVIPVSCVEQGRWQYRSAEFSSGGRNLYASGRAAKMAQVSESMQRYGSRHSDQGAVWDDIFNKSRRMGAKSSTSAAQAMYDRAKPTTDEFKAGIQWQHSQVGAVFAINGAVVGMDVFDSSHTMGKVMPKLVESYALDAIDTPSPVEAAPGEEIVKAFLEQVAQSGESVFSAVGLGEDLRLSGDGIAGGALKIGERVVHLSAFQLRQEAGRQKQRFTRSVV